MELVKQKCEGDEFALWRLPSFGVARLRRDSSRRFQPTTGHALEVWTSAGAARLGLRRPAPQPVLRGTRRLDAALCFCPFCRTDPAVSQRFLPPDLIEPPFPMQRPASVSESAGATQLKEASSGRTVRLRAHFSRRSESPLQVNVTCNRLQLRRRKTRWGAARGERRSVGFEPGAGCR